MKSQKTEKTQSVNSEPGPTQKPAEKVARSTDQAREKAPVQVIDVPLEIVGQHRGKNYVDLKGLSYNSEYGHLSFHLSDKHTMIFKDNFLKKYLKVVLKEAEQVEHAPKKAPQFGKEQVEKSTAKMRLMGERDGRMFMGPTGSAKYDGSVRGFVINLDKDHSLIVDSEILSRELGIKVSPMAMERNTGISR